jgi:protein-L-isoaspartate O-methyltransferase
MGLAPALMATGALTSEWLYAFQAVPRHLFVPDVIWPGMAGTNRQSVRVVRSEEPELWLRAVNSDAPITTQWDDGAYMGPDKGKSPTSSSSMPTMVFSMLDALSVEDGNTVLEIGTGTGWNAGLLTHRLGARNVVSVELDETTAQAALARLRTAGFEPLVVVGDGAEGYAVAAPYDRVIATASVGRVPRQWIEQTRPGGIIVTPWGPTYGGEGVVRLTVAGDGTASGRFIGASAFMRLREQRARRVHVREYLKGEPWPANGRLSVTRRSPEDVGDWPVMFALGVQIPEAYPWAERYEGGSYTLWLRDTAVSSWATADYEPGRTRFKVYQSGPRKLWDEVVTAYRWWERQGRPGFERFGLTVDGERETVWLDQPDNPVLRR